MTIESVKYWCEFLEIKNYTIRDNGIVDVDCSVNIAYKNLKKIPVQFGEINGSFYCRDNELTTLEGSPYLVSVNFDCSNNKLTNLIGGPIEVNNNYYCYNNELITLEGYPKDLKGVFDCSYNPIYDIYVRFNSYRDYINSLDYNYLRGTNVIKHRFAEACEEAGITVPESIPGYKYI